MKWFKHMSDAASDSFVSDLMDEFGHFGYAGWFIVLELVAKENGANVTGRAEFSEAFLRRNLRVSSTKLQQFLNFCSTKGKLSFNFSEKKVILEIPKLLKLKDNHTNNLQVACKKVSPILEAEEEGEVEKEKSKTLKPPKGALSSVQQERFDQFWDAYGHKKSKGGAEAAWKSISPDEQLHKAIMAGVKRATTSSGWNRDGGTYRLYPERWLKRRCWEDEHETATTLPISNADYSEGASFFARTAR